MMDESRSGPDPFPRAQMGSRGDIYRTSLDHEMLSLILSSILDLRCLQRSDMPIRQRYHPSSCPLSSPEWSCRRHILRSVPCDGPGQLGVLEHLYRHHLAVDLGGVLVRHAKCDGGNPIRVMLECALAELLDAP